MSTVEVWNTFFKLLRRYNFVIYLNRYTETLITCQLIGAGIMHSHKMAVSTFLLNATKAALRQPPAAGCD